MLVECVRILLRRRWFVVFALVLALGAGTGAYTMVKPKQSSTAEMLFLPSSAQPGTASRHNPFLDVGQSTLTMSFVVQTAVLDNGVASALARRGFTAKYTIVPNPAPNSGPTLLIRTEDKSPRNAQQTLQAVLSEMQVQLRAKQRAVSGVPDKLFVTSMVITRSPHASPLREGQLQATVIAFAVMFFLLIIVIVLVERRRTSKQRSKSTGGPKPVRPNRPDRDMHDVARQPPGPRRPPNGEVVPVEATAPRRKPRADRPSEQQTLPGGEHRSRSDRGGPNRAPLLVQARRIRQPAESEKPTPHTVSSDRSD